MTVDDYEAVPAFYRDALGLPVVEEWNDPGGKSAAVLDDHRARVAGGPTLGVCESLE